MKNTTSDESLHPLENASSTSGRHLPIAERGNLGNEPIAIIGISGNFPKARNIEGLWEVLNGEKDCITEVPADRWDWRAVYGDPATEPNKTNVKWGGFADGIDEFDPLFFGISPREAETMNPHQRLMMTHLWNVVEDAGYSAESLSGTDTGIFVGTGGTSYSIGYTHLLLGSTIPLDGYVATSLVPSVGPNRMSYFLNLHGPSEPVETACSSSLVAIHRGVRAIRHGDCQMALVGGVNTMVTSHTFISHAKAGMLSKDGRCKTFSAQANGYARGEGVGMLFLKGLGAAERDGDHIYAVIRGSAENHGGRANSLTAPNPKAQAELIKSAFRDAKIDPRTVTYIEAHGTGTPLGDPIEINGLKSAFKDLYQETAGGGPGGAHCGIGSVKTNIGHLEMAAGVAGVIKVLLQMKHRKLVKSLHCEQINPLIQLQDSPFYIVRESREWKTTQDSLGKPLPRRAGVSSFGFGGVNAHVLLEEYVKGPTSLQARRPDGGPQEPAMIVLSAKTENALRERAKQLVKAIEQKSFKEDDLPSIAYTLQLGREAMDERLALSAASLEQLASKLNHFLGDNPNGSVFHRGKVKRARQRTLSGTAAASAARGIDDRRRSELMDLWVGGHPVEWAAQYGSFRPRRIALPLYPFSSDRYWIRTDPAPSLKRDSTEGAGNAVLHPLVHKAASGAVGQQFESTFTGDEFFLSDHVVAGMRILPGVCGLEMARAAIEQAAAAPRLDQASRGRRGVTLKNVVWIRPLVVNKPKRVDIVLVAKGSGEFEFAICDSQGENASIDAKARLASAVVYCRGAAMIADFDAAPRIDLESLRQQSSVIASSNECYETFKRLGIEYGDAHRGILAIAHGNSAATGEYLLATITLPACVQDSREAFVLHPSVMDAALQAVIGFRRETLAGLEGDAGLPFTLEQLETRRGTPTCAYVVIRRTSRTSAAEQQSQTVDIEIFDERGELCVVMKGLTTRRRGVDARPELTAASSASPAVKLFHRQWVAKPAPEINSQRTLPDAHWIVLCGTEKHDGKSASPLSPLYQSCVTRIKRELPSARCSILMVRNIEAGGFPEFAWSLFSIVQEILASRRSSSPILQVIVPRRAHDEWLASVSALLKTAQLEYPQLRSQIISMDLSDGASDIVKAIRENIPEAEVAERLRYHEGGWETLNWVQLPPTAEPPSMPWKRNGVYLITGGAGGLGLLFAREIAARAANCVLVLVGRSVITERFQTHIDALGAGGCRVSYRQVDLNNLDAVRELVADIQNSFGHLDGVMHCAGVLRDSLIQNKKYQDFIDVLRPKTTGVLNLDAATQALDLDFFITFSSVSGVLGNIGQADYAVGNAFMDEFAHHRDGLRLQGERSGRTLSINWPLWQSGGMQVGEQAMAQLRRRGVEALSSEQGIRAVYDAWMSHRAQVLVFTGDAARIARPARAMTRVAERPAPCGIDEANTGSNRESLEMELIREVSTQLKVKPADIDVEAKLGDFGLDSIGLTELANVLNRRYQLMLSPTIFFEYPTLHELAGFLSKEHEEQVGAKASALTDSSAQKATSNSPRANATATVGAGAGNDVGSQEKLETELVEKVSVQLKVRAEDIDVEAKLGDFGLDSIGLTEFANTLNGCYELQLTPATFFEYPTLREVAQFLAKQRARQVGSQSSIAAAGSQERLEVELIDKVSSQLKVRAEDIDVEAKLGDFGMDSIGLTEFANTLNRCYELQLTPAAFFEYPTLREVAQFLLREHGDAAIPAMTVAPTTAAGVPAHVIREQSAEASGSGNDEARARLEDDLIREVTQQLKVDVDDVDVEAKLGDFGLDSIGLTELANTLNRRYELQLTPASFFEYPTLREFAKFLLEEHGEQVGAQPAMIEHSFQPQHSAALGAVNVPAPVNLEVVGLVAQAPQDKSVAGAAPPDADLPAPDQALVEKGAESIAIIGMSGRFPRAADIDEFWENLHAEKDCITEIPVERWDWRTVYGDPVTEPNKTSVKWGGFIDGIDEFDPLFFGISPREAEALDPQQRLLLMHGWNAVEDAGYSAKCISGTKTAVFVGTAPLGYESLFNRAGVPLEGYSATGSVSSVGPNRMSYFLNWHGPSEPIETACSSSLVAIHRGVRAIRSGDCEMALVGGVNTIVTPKLYISFDKAGMLSKDGHCKTFSAQANGYARGEGVGMLFLKGLNAAERDGDHIYGVIRGSAENHGGRANSLTSPNPAAQAELIKSAFREAKIDPRTVGYIEAHGTGTPLGDPIEINGLKSAFSQLYEETGGAGLDGAHCGIGSVKSNIGHLELAAGVAGVIKVILQMKHRRLVKSLHCDQVNPFIQLQDSPFYLVRESRDWQAMRDSQGRPLPRRAGVSSFGFGGVNAHVVIEEYIRPPAPIGTREKDAIGAEPAMIVLSAKTASALRERAKQLIKAIERKTFQEDDLSSIACTLQTGRDPMEERLALSAGSLQELREKLLAFTESARESEGLYRGDARDAKNCRSLFNDDDAIRGVVESWLAAGKTKKALEAWSKGLDVDWKRLHESRRAKRIALPGYPFARERLWAPSMKSEELQHAGIDRGAAKLHPLVHVNTSVLAQQQFASEFTGEEFFLCDHRVDGQPTMPLACYLEMARAAAVASLGKDPRTESPSMSICEVAWSGAHVKGESPKKLHIALASNDSDEVDFSISTDGHDADSNSVSARGRIRFLAENTLDRLDFASLQAQCDESVSVDTCYETLGILGMGYGNALRAMKTMRTGADSSGRRFALAEVRLPSCVADTRDWYGLHPSVLGCAFQAAIACIGADKSHEDRRSAMSYTSLDEFEIVRGTPSQAYLHLRFQESDERGLAVDVDIADANGNICVRLKGLRSEASAPQIEVGQGATGQWFAPVWDVVPVDSGQLWPELGARVLLVSPSPQIRNMLAARYSRVFSLDVDASHSIEKIAEEIRAIGERIDHVVWSPRRSESGVTLFDDSLIAAQESGVMAGFRLIKALLQLGYDRQVLGWSVLTQQALAIETTENNGPAQAAIHGLFGSLAKEFPAWQIRLLDLPRDGESVHPQWLNVPHDSGGETWALRHGEWYRQRLCRFDTHCTAASPYRRNGTYVLIGGAGGLGQVLSEYLIRHYQANVVWIGRRGMDESIEAAIGRLAALGPAPQYISADAGDRESLEGAYEKILQNHQKLHGVVHTAMVLLDKGVANMPEEEFGATLRSKVNTSVRLAQVFGRQALDFIVMFSSLQSFTRSAGQSNYAAGCTFVDAFATRLAEEFPIKVINWGYWGAVGAVSSTEHQVRMRGHGFESIESSEGMSALEVLLSSRLPQLVYVKTNSDAALARFVGDDAVSCLLDSGVENLRVPGESRGETALRTTSDSETGASA